MTTAPPHSPLTAPTRARVGLAHLLRAAWYQHRGTLIGFTLAALALIGVALGLGHAAPGMSPTGGQNLVQLYVFLADCYALAVGVFLAAPLLAREYEHRTHLWAWSQDVGPTRWLAGKVLVLLPLVTALAAALGLALHAMSVRTGDKFSAFHVPWFDASGWEQASSTMFAFALGLALAALLRRSVASMVVTFVGFLATRIVLAFAFRPSYLAAAREISPLGETSPPRPGTFTVDTGFLDAAGQEVSLDDTCPEPNGYVFDACQRQRGVTRSFTDYQPDARILDYHLVEAGIFVVLAVALLALALVLVRRAVRS